VEGPLDRSAADDALEAEGGDGVPKPNGDGVTEPSQAGRGIPRRTFIAGAGALTGAAAVDYLAHAAFLRSSSAVAPKSLLGIPLPVVTAPIAPTITVMMRRREDMLFMRVDGYNLVRKGQKLVRKRPGKATIVFTFVPQHLTEQAFFETKTNSGFGNETPASPGSTNALLAEPSRIAFNVPAHMHSIPFTVAGLLNWSQLELALAPAAAYVPPPSLIHFLSSDRKERLARERRARALGAHGHEARAHEAHGHEARGRGTHGHEARAGGASPVSAAGPAPPLVIFGFGHPPVIRAPEPTETSIELPWHLAISPIAGSQWSHPTDPITLGGATELWRTRLAKSPNPNAGDGGALRAVWNFDTQTRTFASPGPPTLKGSGPAESALGPFRTSLTPSDRYQIVKLTSDFALSGRADIQAKKLWLTSRGGFLDSDGVWDDPTLSLVEWKHLATLGRDQYVKVVNKGFLFPFGHHVVQVTVTERQFEEIGGEIVATSRQIVYLVVREPTLSYDPADTFGIANNSRDFPFRSLTLNTLRTPNLDPAVNFLNPSLGSNASLFFTAAPYVPTVSGVPFKWHFVGTDWVGRSIPFTSEAVFVAYQDATNALPASIVRNRYNGLAANDPTRMASLDGQTIAFAEALTLGDTDLQVKSITFGAGPGAGGSTTQFQDNDTAQCYPTLSPSINNQPTGAQAVVRLASAEQASGGAPLKGNPSPAVAYYPPYITTGFSTSQQPTGNAGNVYMEILFNASNATNLSFGNGSSGGVLTPNLQLQGISRSLGPVADLDNIFNGRFDPNSVFTGLTDDLQARILGGVPLSELIAPVTSFLDGGTPEIPSPKALRITYTTNGTVVTTTVVWKPDIVTDNPIVTPRGGGSTTAFTLDATITTDLANPNNSSFTIQGKLTNFVVNLMSTSTDQFIQVTFNSLTFSSASGQKADVSVDIHGVQFVGPLKFVQQLEEFMSFAAGGGGPKIELLPTGISADLDVQLPTIAVGLFQLSHVGVDANFMLPFDGTPAVFGFGFSTRDNPFQLSLAIFGGGGYFGIKIGTDGVHEIDAGFDFGAMAAINLGVASGSVSLTAGFQFTYDLDPSTGQNTCILTGYVKLTGSMSILGIIQMSLEFDLSLTWEETSGGSEVTGTATISISISILFFHFSVSATATKTFENDSSTSSIRVGAGRHARALTTAPPTFADQMSFTDWQAYCSAFAA
jgi:hypothetical protein